MNYSLAHLVIMAMTIGVVLAGGLYAARSVKSAEGFSLGGRSAGIPMIAGSIAGTCVGGGATVGTAQLAGSIGLSAVWFTIGLSAVWFTIGVGLSLLIMGIIYARPLRYTGLETISQYLVENYGKGAGRFTSFATSLGILFSAVASTLPGIGLLAALTGFSYAISAGILLLLVILYAFFGGMKTASVGGILKMLILFVTLFALGIVAWQGLMEASEMLVNKPAGFLSIWGISTGSIRLYFQQQHHELLLLALYWRLWWRFLLACRVQLWGFICKHYIRKFRLCLHYLLICCNIHLRLWAVQHWEGLCWG